MKNICFGFILLWLWSCDNTLKFDFPDNNNIIYCNSLFSPDECWSATIGYTYSFSGNSLDSRIEDALVYVINENNDTIHLKHNQRGTYIADGHKPETGVDYRIFVVFNNDTLKSSKSRIPDSAEFEIIELNEDPGNAQLGFYPLTEVYELNCSLKIIKDVKCNLLIRNLLFDHNNGRGVGYYLITEEVLKIIKDSTGNTNISDKLQVLKSDTIYSYDDFSEIVLRVSGNQLSDSILQFIIDASYAGSSLISNNNTRKRISCYSGSPQFINFQNEKYSLLGTFDSSTEFGIYVWDFLSGDYWLDVKVLSPEAYSYYNDLILQYSSRIDQHTIQNPVYSNIKNGTGIFAGYKQQLILYKKDNSWRGTLNN